MKKTHKVVILPQNKKEWSKGEIITISPTEIDIAKADSTSGLYNEVAPDNFVYKAQHLYFISGNKPKLGQWYYDCEIDIITKAVNDSDTLSALPREIVASTDPSLGLPAIPLSFLKKYAETNGKIDKVKLEIKSCRCGVDKHSCEFYTYDNICSIEGKLKLTTSNEVVVVSSVGDIIKQDFLNGNIKVKVIEVNKELEDVHYEEIVKAAKEYRKTFVLWQTSDELDYFEQGYIAGYKAAEEKEANLNKIWTDEDMISFANWVQRTKE